MSLSIAQYHVKRAALMAESLKHNIHNGQADNYAPKIADIVLSLTIAREAMDAMKSKTPRPMEIPS